MVHGVSQLKRHRKTHNNAEMTSRTTPDLSPSQSFEHSLPDDATGAPKTDASAPAHRAAGKRPRRAPALATTEPSAPPQTAASIASTPASPDHPQNLRRRLKPAGGSNASAMGARETDAIRTNTLPMHGTASAAANAEKSTAATTPERGVPPVGNPKAQPAKRRAGRQVNRALCSCIDGVSHGLHCQTRCAASLTHCWAF